MAEGERKGKKNMQETKPHGAASLHDNCAHHPNPDPRGLRLIPPDIPIAS
jgi:hypothetical protein